MVINKIKTLGIATLVTMLSSCATTQKNALIIGNMNDHSGKIVALESFEPTNETYNNPLSNYNVHVKIRSSIFLDISSYPTINSFIETIKDSNESIGIVSHTDSIGSARVNLFTTCKQGNAVARYLIDKGIDSSRLVVIGLGESYPLKSNVDAIGRKTNRRVEFIPSIETIPGPHNTSKYRMICK